MGIYRKVFMDCAVSFLSCTLEEDPLSGLLVIPIVHFSDARSNRLDPETPYVSILPFFLAVAPVQLRVLH